MLCRKLFFFLAFAHTTFFSSAQYSALDKAFQVPATFRESQSQLDSLLTLGPLKGKAENERLCQISRLYRESDANKAIEFAKSSIEKIEKTDDPSSLERIYEIYGHSLSVQGNFPAASRYFTKALSILNKQKDTLSLATKNHLLAYTTTYGADDGFKTKMNHLHTCYKLFEHLKNYEGMGAAMYGLGVNIYYEVIEKNLAPALRDNLLKEALKYSIRADSFWIKANMKDRRAAAIVSQAQIQHLLGRSNIAKSLIRKAYLLHKKEKSCMGMQRCAWSMARILHTEQKLDSAIFLMQQSVLLLERANAVYELQGNYDFQTILYKDMRNYPEALRTSELARDYREKSFKINHLSEVASIKNNYENQLKDERIKELETEKRLQESIEKQKLIIAISTFSILMIVIVLGAFGYYQRQRSINQMMENIKLGSLLQRNLEEKLQDIQLAALKAQMNPHFIGNAINAVQNLILQEKKEDALHYLNDFSKLTRHALENSKKDTIALKEEVEFLGHYFNLEQLRYPDKFDFDITIDPSIEDPGYERIPPMMIQPFIENAIKHGLHHKSEKGNVKVLFKLADAELMCIIEDDGVGREAAARIGQRKSHSTEITDARLELLQKKADFQQKYKIRIEDLFDATGKPVGTKVVMVIPTGRRSLMVG